MAQPLIFGLTDEMIVASVGADAYQRGRAYARDGKVLSVKLSGAGSILVASVQGNRTRPYQTIVRFEVDKLGEPSQAHGVCTCPVAIGCKHVAATMIAARGELSSAKAGSVATAAWELPLAALVEAQDHEESSAGTPFALQFEIVPPARLGHYSRWRPATAAPEVSRVRIRPVVPGRSGKWVRSGVTWRDLACDVWNPRVPAHREALRELFAAYQSRGTGYSSYGPDQAVYLDDFGSSLWPLLLSAVEVGVALVPVRPALGPVALAPAPAAVALDLTRGDGSSGVRLTPVVTVQGVALPLAQVQLVGHPAHGLLLDRSTHPQTPQPGLLLAPLVQALSQPLSEMLSHGHSSEIPEGDVSRFLQVYYPRLRQVVAVVSSDDSVSVPEVRPPRLTLTVTHLPEHQIRLDWSFAYVAGDATTKVALSDPGGLPGLRDLPAERRLLADLELDDLGLMELRAVGGRTRVLAPSVHLRGLDAARFATDVLPGLIERDDLDVEVVGVAPDYRHCETPPEILLSATETSDTADWFDLAVTVSVDGEGIPFQDLFAALARGESHLVLASGTFFSIERPEYDELRRLIEEARNLQDHEHREGLRLSPYQAGLWADLARLGVVDEQSTRWADTVKGLLDLDQIPQPDLPTGVMADLRPYQREGYSWLSFLHSRNLGGILADDMGLGKTLQTLALICRVTEEEPLSSPFLVVAPTSVVHNWGVEAARFTPGLDVVCISETESRGAIGLAERVKGAHVVVTSYALFRIDYDAYDALDWSGLVLDEAQYVKNHQAKTYQCVRRLAAPFKLAITGTPLENNLMDLWSLMSIVAPGMFPSPQRFTQFYRRPIEKGTSPELLATLRRRIGPLMLRRTKEAVASELPPKQEQVLEVMLHPRHSKIYQTHLQRERQKVLGLIGDMDRNRFVIFRSLTLLRQLSLAPALVDPRYADVRSSKVDALLEQLDEVVREGHRALVFSQFTGFLTIVRHRLDEEGIDYCYLDGRTRDRHMQINAFKQGAAPVFLISLKAGGFGLTLTEADYVFVLDPWWNPAVEAQAVDRTHRIGQDKTVMVYRLVAADTIEEKVMELKVRKQELFTKVMDDDALLAAPLTVDDVKGLFGL